MKILLGIGIAILLKIIAFQSYVADLWNEKGSDASSNGLNFQLSDLDFTMINAFILLTIGILIFNWLKKKINHQQTPVSSLRTNVAKLRNENILLPQNVDLMRRRKKLVRLTKSVHSLNPKLLNGTAKKLGVASGELMLAAKIQSGIK